MSMIEDIGELQRKAGNYDMLKQENDRSVQRIKEIAQELNSIVEKFGFKIEKSNKYGVKPRLIKHLYQKMKEDDSFQVTRDIVEKEGRVIGIETNTYLINNVLQDLKTYEGIKFAKDGKRLRLFFHKKDNNDEKIEIEKTSFMG